MTSRLAISLWLALLACTATARTHVPPAPASSSGSHEPGRQAVASQAPGTTSPSSLEEQIDTLLGERKFAEAMPLAERLVAAAEAGHGRVHPEVADALIVRARVEAAAGQAARALASLERAIRIREQAFGSDNPAVADACNELAIVHFGQGNYAAAEPLMQRALSIRETALGKDSPEAAQVVNNLAQVYQEMGDYNAAEPLLTRALDLFERAREPDQGDIAIALNNLAGLYSLKGDYVRSEPLFRRALAIREQADGPESMPTAQVLNNLGLMYQRQGALDRARPLFERSLAIREARLGATHVDVARVLNNLAIVHQEQADLDTAERLYTRALAIYEAALGPRHPLVAQTVNNLAVVYLGKRDFARAGPMFARAVDSRRSSLGPWHPDMNRALTSQAVFFDLTGRVDEALRLQTEATDVGEHNLALVLASGSESQKLRYMETFAEGTDVTVSLHRRSAPADEAGIRLALTTVFRRKGRVLDAMSRSLQAVREGLSPEGRAALDELASVRGDLARRVLRGPGRTPPAEFEQDVARLEERSQQLEAALSQQSAAYRSQAQPVTIAAIQAALPADAALIEFIQYRPFDPLALARDARFGPSRYVAFVLTRTGAPLSIDVGDAAVVDRLVDAARRAMRDPRDGGVARAARALDEQVMQPVRERLGGRSSLFVSPDAALNLVPFGALVDEQGRYLVERFTISYLTSGRDLLRTETPTTGGEAPLLVANPAFGTSSTGAGPAAGEARAADLSRARFLPLPGTAGEAVAIEPLLPGVRVLTGEAATEHAVKSVHGPRVLHVATHGFFLDDASDAVVKEGRFLVMDAASAPASSRIENPLLRAGLALAGANRRDGGDGEDGILTALEATALDLWGTRLAVLSACETGLGEVRRGDGVYGLRRALVMAGAESQLMTLWQVSDRATGDLMASYYGELQHGAGRAEGLRTVQLRMLRQGTRRHPYYWSGVILSGARGPLN